MSNQIPPQPEYDPAPTPAVYASEPGEVAYYDEFDDPAGRRRPGQRNQVKRYLGAVWRRRWLLAIALVVGVAGGVFAYTNSQVEYTARGNLWIQVESGNGDITPITQGELFESTAWVELLRSFAVLDHVVEAERLYLTTPPEYSAAFSDFGLAESYAPGSYTLSIGPDGQSFILTSATGARVQSGTLGEPIGNELGFFWRPDPGAFPPEAEFSFAVTTPRDASISLRDDLQSNMDKLGNFIALSLSGPDPEKVASVLNRVMERHVELAGELKGGKLDEQLEILEEQLATADMALDVAEQELEAFRVRTATLPTDRSTPIAPGLAETRDPVFDRYFQMKIDLEELRRSQGRLREAAADIRNGDVQLSALEGIPELASSAELEALINELVEARSNLRRALVQFTEDYPPVQDLRRQIRTLETQAIPTVVEGLLAELAAQEADLQNRVDSASVELEAVPIRSIEESRRRRQVTIQENLYNELRSRVETMRLAARSSIADVQILDRASVPQNPSADNRITSALMILLGSLGGAIGIAILLDRADRRIRHADEVADDIGLEILGAIPRVAPPGSKDAEENAAQVVEAFRELRVTVAFAHGVARPLMLTITSPAQNEGKTLISTNLAVAFAEMGRRTLLIDGDTRRGDAHRLLGVERVPGLSDYLRDRSSSEIIRKTDYEHLDFIPCGTRGTSTPELLASRRMTEFLGSLKRAYDVIIIDSPPLAAGADLMVLAGLSGQLAVVLRTGSTDKRLAVAKLDGLSRLPIRILGAILNDVEAKGDYYTYYASYLSDYRPRDEEGAVKDHETPLLSGTGAAGTDD